MPTVNIYLTFNGNCEEAFNFYKSAFGGDFSLVSRFKDMPSENGNIIPPEIGEKIMHISLPISKETVLMGSDSVDMCEGEEKRKYIQGNNFSISISTETEEEAERLFNLLSANGQITMPLSKTFWGAYFGMFTDQFGINWMVSTDLNEKK